MYWPLLNMYSENFGFGPGGFSDWGDHFNSGEGITLLIKTTFNYTQTLPRNLQVLAGRWTLGLGSHW